MSSLTSMKRVSEMWNNCSGLDTDSTVNNKQHVLYKQYNENGFYHNDYAAQHYPSYGQLNNYSHVSQDYSKLHGNVNQNESVVKSEPAPWYYYQYGGAVDVSKSNELNQYYHKQRHETSYGNYEYDTRMQHNIQQHYVMNTMSNYKAQISPTGSSTSDNNYRPPSNSDTSLFPNQELDDSPNLRALLVNSNTRKWSPYHTKDRQSFKPIQSEISHEMATKNAWTKNRSGITGQSECNLSEFHGGYDATTDNSQTSIKSDPEHKAVIAGGGAGSANAGEGAPSSLAAASDAVNCQDMTRVEAGGDKADYADDNMAASTDTQGIYPWMKSIGGKLY